MSLKQSYSEDESSSVIYDSSIDSDEQSHKNCSDSFVIPSTPPESADEDNSKSTEDIATVPSSKSKTKMRYSTLSSKEPLANSTVIHHDADDSDDSIIIPVVQKNRRILKSDDENEDSYKNISHNESVEFETRKPNNISHYRSTISVPSDSEDESLHSIYDASDDESSPTKEQSDEVKNEPESQTIKCKRSEYNKQLEKINELQDLMLKTKQTISRVKLSNLPDNGEQLKQKFEDFKFKFQLAQEKLRIMVVAEEDVSGNNSKDKNWDNIKAGIAIVQPKTFGVKGLQNYDKERALTAQCLENIHGSLNVCPNENQMANDPKDLKIPLMEHQKRALVWLLYRETQKPRGGILADDMGLGKTLSMISLILASVKDKENSVEEEEHNEENVKKYSGNTLIICPASLINQWSNEIETKVKRGRLTFNIHHGSKREVKRKKLTRFDVVISTYQTIMSEHKNEGAVFGIRWERIILDEAHQIRNFKSLTSEACCALSAKTRWALTGTPVQNKEMDMYALLKFLRCAPFDDLMVWRRWISDKVSGGGERLHAIISSLMLRRTKTELMDNGKLDSLPPRKWELITVTLEGDELQIYQKVLLFSQTLFAQFLHQRAQKHQETVDTRVPINNPNSEYFKMRQKLLKLNKMKDISGHEILVLLLRLRQICCHPFLITKMLEGNEDLGEGEPGEEEHLNLLEQLNRLNIEDTNDGDTSLHIQDKGVGLSEATKGVLNPNHPVFNRDRMSSKIKSAMKVINEILKSDDKIVIVSQWVGYLDLIAHQLKKNNVHYLELNGSIPTDKRFMIIDNINNPNSKYKVLLLSMTAGGVGLNLVGANHLLLLDLHWNPQIENQAQDRIYRMGQKKNVYIYKFMTSDTIEERIKNLQENKLAIAESVLTGSKQVSANKLSLQDLKLLFNM